MKIDQKTKKTVIEQLTETAQFLLYNYRQEVVWADVETALDAYLGVLKRDNSTEFDAWYIAGAFFILDVAFKDNSEKIKNMVLAKIK